MDMDYIKKGDFAMTSEEYKRLSLKEFNQAAEKFDDNDPSVYNMCRKDYPDVLAEVIKAGGGTLCGR